LPVWESATRVEAYVDLDDFERAAECLDDYLAHPDVEAFEVASTYRQFDEVLQLSTSDAGRRLLERLGSAAERLRGGSPIGDNREETTYLLVSVTDPRWEPREVPDLEVRARLGTILSVSGSDRTVKALLKDSGVNAVEESRPTRTSECERSVPFVGVASSYLGSDGGTFSEDGREALVAIIDDGIDVLHETFLDADGQSRIIGIWDQLDADGPPPPVPYCDFGTFHTHDDINRFVTGRKTPATLRRPNMGHGTHVAIIAAGRRCGAFAGGVAPGSQILVVISRADQPTGYSDAHVAALAFIDHMATDLNKPVVVNLSQGMNAGAHDGLSTVEAMFDNFTNDGLKRGRIVVKSAGVV
jgi:subtilisin family serine protease